MQSRSVTVTAAELPAYIAALPRLLTESLNIHVTQGTIPSKLELANFCGPGAIAISGNGSIAANGISVGGCSIYTRIIDMDIPSWDSDFAVTVITSNLVALDRLVIDGQSSGSADNNGVYAELAPTVIMSNCTFRNLSRPVYAVMATITVQSASTSGNTYGAAADRGGLIYLAGSTPELLGGSANTKWGGLIARGGVLI